MHIGVKKYSLSPLKVELLFYSRYTYVYLWILNSEMYIVMYAKYTYNVSIYGYYRLTSKICKMYINFYMYNPFHIFTSKIIFDCK